MLLLELFVATFPAASSSATNTVPAFPPAVIGVDGADVYTSFVGVTVTVSVAVAVPPALLVVELTAPVRFV
jgi:hypothetical protein